MSVVTPEIGTKPTCRCSRRMSAVGGINGRGWDAARGLKMTRFGREPRRRRPILPLR